MHTHSCKHYTYSFAEFLFNSFKPRGLRGSVLKVTIYPSEEVEGPSELVDCGCRDEKEGSSDTPTPWKSSDLIPTQSIDVNYHSDNLIKDV